MLECNKNIGALRLTFRSNGPAKHPPRLSATASAGRPLNSAVSRQLPMAPLLAFLALIAAIAAAPFLLSLVVAKVTERENKERSKLAPPILFSFYRLITVVLCYALSSYGLMLSVVFMRSATSGFRSINVIAVVWSYAWLCHAVMSGAWIINRKLPKIWPISGTLAAFVSLVLVPLMATIGLKSGVNFSLSANLAFVAYEIFVVLPCLLLAIYLARFHLKGSEHAALQANG